MGKRGNGEGSIYQREIKRKLKDGSVTSTSVWCAAVSLDSGKRKIVYGKTRQDVGKKLTKALQRKVFAPQRLRVAVCARAFYRWRLARLLDG